MSTGPNRILDEFAKLVTDAAGAAQGVRREVETAFRAQAERLLNSMEIVQREEFEAVREMAAKRVRKTPGWRRASKHWKRSLVVPSRPRPKSRLLPPPRNHAQKNNSLNLSTTRRLKKRFVVNRLTVACDSL